MNGDLKSEIRERLLEIPLSKSVSFDMVVLRCAFCGDSRKDPLKTRFYVKINPNTEDPILYMCHNCGVSGILTPSVLRTFEINDLNINGQLLSFNKKITKTLKKQLGIYDNTFDYKVPIPANTQINHIKKKYINDRLGLNLSFRQMMELKIIFSLEEFLNQNKIDEVTLNNDRLYALNSDYVGFLSVRNEFIIYRDITNSHKLRYDKYSINRNIDNTRKFYSIPVNIDMLSTETIYINLAEGAFDILGVYFHIRDQNKINNIYAAVSGSAYTAVIKYFIQLGIFGDNIIVNIYSDADKPPYYYKKLKSELGIWFKDIRLYYNEIGKDFGVPKDKIRLISKKIR